MNEIFVILIVIFITGLTVYIHQKLKNQATKQDIAGITNEVEKVKSKYIFQLEELKLDLEHKSAAVSQKRDLYKKVTDTMRIFIRGGGSTAEKKEDFLRSYQHIWLWGSDEVVSNLTKFIRSQLVNSDENQNNDQTEAKKAYANCIISMRKDVGYIDTKLTSSDYEFINLD